MEEAEPEHLNDLARRLKDCAEDPDTDLTWLEEMPGENIARAILIAQDKDPSFTIETHVSHPIAGRLLNAFSEARLLLTGAEFDAAWESLSFSMDISVWGGDPFQPVLLPNGTLLFRNHHRIIGTADTPYALIHSKRSRLRRETGWVLKQARKRDPSSAFMLHRMEAGEIIRTRKLPDRLSETGQTILLLNDEINLDRMKALSSSILEPVMHASRTGHAVLRYFGDHVFVYPTHRFDDSLDVLLEEFAEAYLTDDDENEPIQVHITPERSQLQEFVTARTQSMLENEDNLEIEEWDVMFHYLNQSITAPKWGSYAGRKVSDMMHLPAFFAASERRPVGYGDGYGSDTFERLKTRVWELNKRTRGHAAVLFIPLIAFAGSHELLEGLSSQCIEEAITPLLSGLDVRAFYVLADAILETPQRPLRAFEAAGDFDVLKTRAQAAVNAALAEAGPGLTQEEIDELVRDIIGYQDTYQVAVVLKPRKKNSKIELQAWGREVRNLSERIDGPVSFHFPRFGMLQSYDRGEDDSGNAFLLAAESDVPKYLPTKVNDDVAEEF